MASLGTNVGGIYYECSVDTRKLIDGEREVKRRLGAMGSEADRLKTRFTAMAAGISAALSAIAIEGFAEKIISAQRRFDVLSSSLKTVTGSTEAAGIAWEKMVRFAATTPYTLDQAVQGFVRMKSLGLDPTEKTMTSLGNTAAAMGKDLMQMVEAVADASTGEFERLKEFGIKARVEGDKVAMTFQGTTTKINNNASDIVRYLVKIGETDFAGAMADRMNTLDGAISNLGDSLDGLYLSIAQSGFGEAIAQGVRAATDAISELSTSIRDGDLTEYFANMRPAIAVVEVAAMSLAGVIAARLVPAIYAAGWRAAAMVSGMTAATAAARGFTAVLAAMGGPIGIAVTALGLLALNWDKVTGSAKSAAELSEQSADRIAAALKKSAGGASRDLGRQLEDAQKSLKSVDDKLLASQGKAVGWQFYSKEDIAELQDQRAQILKVIDDIKKAQDSLHGGAGRGKINPDTVTPDNEPGDTSKPSKFDSAGYIANLRIAATQDAIKRIDLLESEALRQNKERLAKGELDEREHAEAVTLIRRKAAQDRAEIQQGLTDLIKQKEDEQKEKDKKKAEQGQEYARGVIADQDPVAKLQVELEEKQALLQQYYETDKENAELYAQARVALEQQTQQQIADIMAQRQQAQTQANQMMMSGYSGLFGSLADMTAAFGGKQSGAYRALFAASKAFAIAESIIKIQQGIAAAAALPFPTNIPAMATVAAQTMGIITTIKGTNYGGGRRFGGSVSEGSLYRVNESGRPEMYTSSTGQQYMLPTQGGNVTPADKVQQSASSMVVNVHNNNGSQVSTRRNSKGELDVFINEVAQQIASNSGPVWSAMKAATSVQSKL